MLAQLQRNAFLTALAAPDAASVTKHLSAVELTPGQSLYKSGDTVTDVIFPHSGLVVLTIRQRDDGAAGVGLVGRDGMVGGFAAAASIPASSNAEVYIAGRASRMPAPAFRQLLESHPGVRQLAARLDSAALAQARQTAYCNAIHPIEARICRLLADVLDRSSEDCVPFNQSTLAEILSARRTTITLVVGRLEAAGVLRWRRGYVDILDRVELVHRSCGCYGSMRRYQAQLFPDAGGARGAAVEQKSSDTK